MRKIYFLFYLFMAVATTWGQPKKQEKSEDFSLNQLLENVTTVSKKDSALYKKSLKTYLQKAKETKNNEHLFNAYLSYVYYERKPEIMHLYTDSIYEYAKKTQQPLNIIKAHQTRSTVYYIEKKYKKSLEYELAALHLIDENKNPYEYHKTLYSIGLTHFYLQQYQEASNYFTLTRGYFENKPDYNALRGYMNSIRYEALSATYMGRYGYSNELIKTGSEKLLQIKKDDRSLEKSYLDYVYGINLYGLKQYGKSIDILNGALAEITKNEDYANEHNVYYYLGLNYWALGQKDQAFIYFNKIDEVFITKHYSNLEIKNAYNYLLVYFKELKKEEKELYYTNQFLNVTVFLQNEYKYLSTALHKQLDIKHLETEKKRLENSLRMKDLWLQTAFVGGGVALIIFIVLLFHNYRKKKEYLKRYSELTALRKSLKDKPLLLTEIIKQEEIQEEPVRGELLSKKEDTCVKKNDKCCGAASDKTLNDLLIHLKAFEENHQFLEKDINLNQLAASWNTNRSYLSTLINQNKGKSFTDYLNQLRVDYVMQKLDNEPVWQEYKIQHISEQLGFSSNRSFYNAFIKITGMSPSFYIQKLRSKELV